MATHHRHITPEATHPTVAERAYQIWEDEGKPSGRDIDHWLKAEAELDPESALAMRPKMTAPAKK